MISPWIRQKYIYNVQSHMGLNWAPLYGLKLKIKFKIHDQSIQKCMIKKLSYITQGENSN